MLYIASNIKWLRKRSKKSQALLAEQFIITRGALNSYEHGTAKPHLELLIKMADYFELSADTLLRTDLRNYHEWQFRQLVEREKMAKLQVIGSLAELNRPNLHEY